MFKRSPLKSQVMQKKRRRILALRLFLLVLCGGGLIALFLSISKLDSFIITNITISGNKAVTESVLRAIVETHLEKKYMNVVPRNNALTLPRRAIATEILATFPVIEYAALSLNNLTSMILRVTERVPYVLWCQKNMLNECYLADRTGFIFAPSPEFSNDIYLRFRNDERENPIGTYILDKKMFNALSYEIENLRSLSIFPIEVAIDDKEFELITRDYKIVFDTSKSFEEIFSNLKIVIEKDGSLRRALTTRGALDYIDLRYGNKVFYRLKKPD